MKMRKHMLLTILLGILALAGFSQKEPEFNIKPCFEKYGVDGCFVLYDQSSDKYIRYNPDRCDTGFIPASTFKIPHSLIALEEGIIKDTSQIIKWDGRNWPAKNWNRDQNLKTAVANSCVWVYVDFAKTLGIESYYKYIKAFDYGNRNLMGPPTRFWLDGQLRISANQQIEFLRRFYNHQLPSVSERSVDLVKSMIILEQTNNCILSGKTGGGVLSDTEYIMWLVGYVEKGKSVYFYAMNFNSDNFEKTRQIRYDITKEILMGLNILDEVIRYVN